MESRFSPLLSTNYAASSDELDEIRNLLAGPINQATELGAKIQHLRNTIEQLVLQQTRLHDYITSHKALTAPMRKIPEELLQEIFIHCLPAHHNAIMSDQEAPLLLGRVCSRWRTISRSTPRLWSSIHLTITPDESISRRYTSFIEATTDDSNGSLYAEAAQTWLGRSGGLPPSISFFCPSYNHSLRSEERLLSILVPFSHRWKNTALITNSTRVPVLPSLSREAVPLLETLSFLGATNTLTPRFGGLSLDIFHAPRLKEVSTSHSRFIPQGMNWSRLTSLWLESRGPPADELSPSNALSILRSSPGLTYCRLVFERNSAEQQSFTGDIVTMPVLNTLSINEGRTPSLKSFFEHLRLPALVNLEFIPSPSNARGGLGSRQLSICALFPRLDHLRELTLPANTITLRTLSECLEHTPCLVRLSIQAQSVWTPGSRLPTSNDEVLTFLTPPTSTGSRSLPVLCPRLKILEWYSANISDPILLAFVEQRTTYASIHNIERLERVEISFYRPKEMDVLAVLSPDILADTKVILNYYGLPLPRKSNSPRAGLEEPSRLEFPTEAFRCFYR